MSLQRYLYSNLWATNGVQVCIVAHNLVPVMTYYGVQQALAGGLRTVPSRSPEFTPFINHLLSQVTRLY
jgi:hypothetical protein